MSGENPDAPALAGGDPLEGKRILVTRPAHQSEPFARELRARGAVAVLAPAIEIGPPDDVRAAHRAIDALHEFAWVAFTSRNGVDAFFERLASLDSDARYLGTVKVAAIGSKTADRLLHYGVRADLVPVTYVNEEIARALIERTRERERILIFRAQEARDVLPQMLDDAGRIAVPVAAYKTTLAADPGFAAKVASADVLTFTSASTVRGFAAMLGGEAAAREAARGKTVACIGPIAAASARRTGLTVDVVAVEHTSSALIDALGAHFAART